jgi:hypothetical protein
VLTRTAAEAVLESATEMFDRQEPVLLTAMEASAAAETAFESAVAMLTATEAADELQDRAILEADSPLESDTLMTPESDITEVVMLFANELFSDALLAPELATESTPPAEVASEAADAARTTDDSAFDVAMLLLSSTRTATDVA